MSKVPSYRKHKPSGQAVVTLAGKDYYLGPFGTQISKREYDRVVGEWLAAQRPKTTSRVVTVTEVVGAFWRFVKSRYERNGTPTETYLKYRPALRFLRERYGHTAAADFDSLALTAMRLTLIGRGLSRGYANETIDRIRKAFKWAASQKLIPSSVPENLATVEGLRKGESGAKELPPVKPVDDGVVEATLPFLPQVVGDMVRLQRLTGARPGEICVLRPCDVDRSGELWKFVPSVHKMWHLERERAIFIGGKAQAILSPYLEREPEAFCFSPGESEGRRRALRTQQRTTPAELGNGPGTNRKPSPQRVAGEQYTNDSYRRAIHRACELAFGMPKELRRIDKRLSEEKQAELRRQADEWRKKHSWSPNQLRHTAATEIRRQFGLEGVQCVLGHSRMETSEFYAERNQTLAARVISELG